MNAIDAPLRYATTPLDWTLGDVAEACGGMLVGDGARPVTSVVIDSRQVAAAALFAALPGERTDGHVFAAAAVQGGASAVLVGRGRTKAEPRIEVDDVAEALLAMAVRRRDELDAAVVAVTGSTGKTSTKDLLAAGLGPGTYASPRSFNNELGVPLTILGAPADSAYLVVEAGSRGTGDIAHLAPAIRPDVAVITNLGVVHLETFGTPEALAAAKWELIEALGEQGIAVLPLDEAGLPQRSGPVLTFGSSEAADVWYDGLEIDESGRAAFVLHAAGSHAPVRLALSGAHLADNACAAMAASLALGRDFAVTAELLAHAKGSPWRMAVHQGRFTVVNDAYNANPTSTESALRTVAAMGGRHLAVLAAMAELGPVSGEEHQRMGALANELGFDPVIIVGPDPGYAAGAGPRAVAVADIEAARSQVTGMLGPGDVVLIKGSRVAGLEALALDLIDEAGQ